MVDSWTTKASMPAGRSTFAAASIGNKLYVAGGAPDREPFVSFTPESTLYEWDQASNTWSTKAPLPVGLWRTAAASIGDKLYVVGGATTAGIDFLDDMNVTGALYEWDQASNTWSTKAPLPQERYAHACAAIGTKLYVVGGANAAHQTGPDQRLLYEWDQDTDTWTNKGNLGFQSYDGAVTAGIIGTMLYNIPGGGPASPNANRLFGWDQDLNSWQQMGLLSNAPAKWYVGVAAVGQRVCLVGGAVFGSPLTVHDDTYVWDEATNVWSAKSAMPSKRWAGAAVGIGDKLYYVGGLTEDDLYTTSASLFEWTEVLASAASTSAWFVGEEVAGWAAAGSVCPTTSSLGYLPVNCEPGFGFDLSPDGSLLYQALPTHPDTNNSVDGIYAISFPSLVTSGLVTTITENRTLPTVLVHSDGTLYWFQRDAGISNALWKFPPGGPASHVVTITSANLSDYFAAVFHPVDGMIWISDSGFPGGSLNKKTSILNPDTGGFTTLLDEGSPWPGPRAERPVPAGDGLWQILQDLTYGTYKLRRWDVVAQTYAESAVLTFQGITGLLPRPDGSVWYVRNGLPFSMDVNMSEAPEPCADIVVGPMVFTPTEVVGMESGLGSTQIRLLQ